MPIWDVDRTGPALKEAITGSGGHLPIDMNFIEPTLEQGFANKIADKESYIYRLQSLSREQGSDAFLAGIVKEFYC